MTKYLALAFDVSRYGWPSFYEIDRCVAKDADEAIKIFKKRKIKAPIIQPLEEHEAQLPFLIAEAATFARKMRNRAVINDQQ